MTKKIEIVHADHGLSPEHLEFLAGELEAEDGFFIVVSKLPAGLESLPCALHGPAEGDDPIEEKDVVYTVRNNRPCATRTVARQPRPARHVVSIGIGKPDSILLFTAYGSLNGIVAEREPGDPTLDSWELVQKARAFWAAHALSA